MENSVSSSSVNEALGARFKAGLQSVLGSLVRSPRKMSISNTDTEGEMLVTKDGSAIILLDNPKTNISNGNAPLVSGVNDALLGDPEHGDEDTLNEVDDTLLECEEALSNTDNGVETLSGEPFCKRPRLSSNKLPLPSGEISIDKCKDAITTTDSYKEATDIKHCTKEDILPTSSHEGHINGNLPDRVKTLGNDNSDNSQTMQTIPLVDSAEMDLKCVAKLEGEQKSLKVEEVSLDKPIHMDSKIDKTQLLTHNLTTSESCEPPSLQTELAINETVSDVADTDASKELKFDDNAANNLFAEKLNAKETPDFKSNCSLSPEHCRTGESDDFVSPPALETLQTDNQTSDPIRLQTHVDNELECLDEPAAQSWTPSPLDVRNTMDDLLGKTVEKVDGNPVTNVCTQRASPHVSPSNSDDECHDLVIGGASAEETSDDDSRDGVDAKRVKLSSTVGGRLNKLISHLSTALVEDKKSSELHQDTDQDGHDDLEAIHLKKNGLASFYDAIIKKDVVKDDYHKDLARRHQELQIKSNMDCRKITKILQEVKAVREKLKLMNVRPAQRSVSTQIFSEKLQVPPDLTANKILKSTVLSQKALAEQQVKAAEAKRRTEEEVKIAAIRTKELELAKMNVESRWSAVLKSHPNAPALLPSTSMPRPPSTAIRLPPSTSIRLPPSTTIRLPPSTSIPQAASIARTPPKALPFKPSATEKTSSEVIDLTAEEDVSKNIQKTVASASFPPKPLAAANGLNLFNNNAVRKNLHPAPLPTCPLTGRPCSLLKPSAPRLDLSSKEDGIVLQWNMQVTKSHAKVATYQIFGYKERPGPLTGSEWKKVGDLKALPLPMACTLTQFQTGHTYHFAVRALDDFGRTGPFGTPRSTKLG